MAPRDQYTVVAVSSTEALVPDTVYTKPVLRSVGLTDQQAVELAVVYDSAEEVVGPTEESHAKDAANCYLGLATDYLASFKAAQLGLRAADGVLDTLDRATRRTDDSEEVDCIEPTIRQAFGEIDFEEEEGDADYCPSERDDCSEDDLEYDSEAEVSDEETEAATANGYVQILRRRCRAVRRAGARRAGAAGPAATIGEASLVGMLCEVVSLNFFLAIVGLKLEPFNKRIVKQVIFEEEECTEGFYEQKFSELNLKAYESEEDADYWPSESEDEDSLEYDSEAETSEDEEEDF